MKIAILPYPANKQVAMHYQWWWLLMRFWTAIWYISVTAYLGGSTVVPVAEHVRLYALSGAIIETPCTVGMTVQQCRLLWGKEDVFLSKTTPFCDASGQELLDIDKLKSAVGNLHEMTIIDYAFKLPMTFTVYSCEHSEQPQIIDRLDGVFEPSLKYAVHHKGTGHQFMTIYPANAILFKSASSDGDMVAIPRGQMIATDSILSRAHETVWCDEDGKEVYNDGKHAYQQATGKITVSFTFQDSSAKLSKEILVCTGSTIKDINSRVRRLYGPRFTVKCANSECISDHLASASTPLQYQFTQTSTFMLSSTIEWCRGCTLSISIAVIMFLNAVFFLGMAVYMRHQDREPCHCSAV